MFIIKNIDFKMNCFFQVNKLLQKDGLQILWIYLEKYKET